MSRDRFSGTPRIFLSYARKDGEEFATRLRNRLQTEQPESVCARDLCQVYLRLANPAISTAGRERDRKPAISITGKQTGDTHSKPAISIAGIAAGRREGARR